RKVPLAPRPREARITPGAPDGDGRMNERLSDDERRALLAGDRVDASAPDEDAELGVLASVLADPAVWAEPSPELEDRVVRAVADAEPAPVTRAPAAGGRHRSQ